jgi:hypothetical protein
VSPARGLRDDLRAALPGWVAARVLVAIAWVASLWWTDHMRDGMRLDASKQGLFGWDGAFYRTIADLGYPSVGRGGVRFFPVLPLVARGLGALVASPSFWLLVIANLAALLAAALVHRLCLVEGLGRPAAARTATLLSLVPPSFVLVWAYAESLFLVLAIGAFLALRRERWWLAAVLGAVCALTRPTGAVLALPALIEAARGWRAARPAELLPRAAAVAGPLLGAASFLWWSQSVYDDWQLPLRVQDELRGGLVNPLVRIAEAGVDLAHFDVHGLHFPFAIAMIALCVVAARRLPASYAAFAGAIVLIAVSAQNLNSIERYGLDAFPLVLALALVASAPRTRTNTVVAVCSAGLVGLATLAWLGEYVP